MGTLGGGGTGNWPPDDANTRPTDGGPVSHDHQGRARDGNGPIVRRPTGGPAKGPANPDRGNLPGRLDGIVIPDDPSELAEDAARVRAELRQRRQLGGRPWWLIGVPAQAGGRAPSRLPALLLTLAILTVVTGLIAVGYNGRQQPGTSGSTGTVVADTGVQTLPALDLLDADGAAVSLRALLPGVVLLVDGCDCEQFIAAAAGATPADVSIVVVSRHLPNAAAPTIDNVTRLADPTGELRSLLRLSPSSSSPAVVLVSRTAQIEVVLPQATSVEVIRDPLAALTD